MRRSREYDKRHCIIVAALVTAAVLTANSRSLCAQRTVSLRFFQSRTAELQRKQADNLEILARECERKGLKQAAAETRAVAQPPDGPSLYLTVLPQKWGGDAPAAPRSDPDTREWRLRLNRLQRQFASDLFDVAHSAFESGYISYAYDLVRRVAEHDPDHRAARGLLGYIRYRDLWVTPYEGRMLRRGNVWHERFGWIPRNHVDRYKKGFRFYKRKWVTAEKEAELRRHWRNAWEVRTDHYLIRTNHSLERGVALAQQLEDLYSVFFRMFVGFFTPQEQLEILFEGRSALGSEKRDQPFQVGYFRDRDEYVRAVTAVGAGGFQQSLGVYVAREKAAFFYHDAESEDDSTLLHEATHQLFAESLPPTRFTRTVGRDANFWVVEGIACYMESFRKEADRFRVGGIDNDRFRAARYRGLKTDFFVPLEELTAMGMDDVQASPDIAPLYSQFAGLAHFFMHYDQGRYREAFVQYLRLVYTEKDTPRTLSRLTGESYENLDRQYLEYLRDPQTLAREGSAAARR